MRTSPINALRRIRHDLRRFTERPAVLRKLAASDRARLEEGLRAVATDEPPATHVLLTSTGFRNIGDQAMLEAFLRNVDGTVTAVVGPKSTYTIPAQFESRVTVLRLQSLVYGFGARRAADLEAFGHLISTAKSFSVVGADLMDGGYQNRVSAISWTLATFAAKNRIDTRVLGFSWRDGASESIVDFARQAGEAGVQLYVRDAHSHERLKQQGVPGLRLAADMVFSDDTKDAPAAAELLESLEIDSGSPVLLLNTSGLISRKIDLENDYLQIIRACVDIGFQVVLVPHVDGVDGGDFTVARRVRDRAREEWGFSVRLVEDLLSPRVIRTFAESATFIVTGRMHLAVLGLSQGVPAIVLATQGKVSGLMEAAGLPEYCVEPTPGNHEKITELLRAFMQDAAPTRSALDRALPALRDLARSNFHGLA